VLYPFTPNAGLSIDKLDVDGVVEDVEKNLQ